ncbi:hypothetical protein [Sediminicola luteus]|uniref:Co-chaperone DjlA N-terminal domain-containing protein n=1 Tax=Sediminicola luteus TaxID=319238 RepID=A0A2A4G5G2_9FLAO|nr:hypothetical protein [Sediminicola luteus]PCE62982.1 hypothetical protein B7P33_17045 [Sediminicola luteus]
MYQSDNTEKLMLFAQMLNLAYVDGSSNKSELRVLFSFAEKLGISNKEFEKILRDPEDYPIVPLKSLGARMEAVYSFFSLIYSDAKLDANEYYLVKDYIKAIGFDRNTSLIITNRSIEYFENLKKGTKALGFDQFKTTVFVNKQNA